MRPGAQGPGLLLPGLPSAPFILGSIEVRVHFWLIPRLTWRAFLTAQPLPTVRGPGIESGLSSAPLLPCDRLSSSSRCTSSPASCVHLFLSTFLASCPVCLCPRSPPLSACRLLPPLPCPCEHCPVYTSQGSKDTLHAQSKHLLTFRSTEGPTFSYPCVCCILSFWYRKLKAGPRGRVRPTAMIIFEKER